MSLYICDIADFMNLDGLDLVTPGRKKRVLSFRQPKDQARSLVAGLLLRRFCGVRADDELSYGEHGKPSLKNRALHFNISHSGSYVVLATSDNEVGVDIEIIAPHHPGVATRCYQEPEREWMLREGTEAAFFYLWTGKESVMKVLGTGMSLAPHTFSLLPVDASGRLICGGEMYLQWFEYNGYVICRADMGAAANDDLVAVGARDLCYDHSLL